MTHTNKMLVTISDVRTRPVHMEDKAMMNQSEIEGVSRMFIYSGSCNAVAVNFRVSMCDIRPYGESVEVSRVVFRLAVFAVDDNGETAGKIAEKVHRLTMSQAYATMKVCTFVPVPACSLQGNCAYRVLVTSGGAGRMSWRDTAHGDFYLLDDVLSPCELFGVKRAGMAVRESTLLRAFHACPLSAMPGVDSDEGDDDDDVDWEDFDFGSIDNADGYHARKAVFEADSLWEDEYHDPDAVIRFRYADGVEREVNASVSMDCSAGDGMSKALFSAPDPRPMAPCGPVYVELCIADIPVAGFVAEKLAPEAADAEGFFSADELTPVGNYTCAKGIAILDRVRSYHPSGGAVSTIEQLGNMVGLANVKSKIDLYIKLVSFHRMRADNGISSKMPPLHALFLGSPGTGKTTVAELMGRLMKEAGVLSKGHVIVRERAQIVGRHYGDESEAMRKALEEAEGGVLFIDEAYSLYRENDPKDPGREAIETLLTALADPRRRDWMLILGGYEDKILRMFEMNPGLASRFPQSNRYRFDDYSAEELLEIAEGYCRDNAYAFSDGAREKLLCQLRSDVAGKDETFGNARHVLNLLETEILPAMAGRVSAMADPTAEALTLILPEDIVIRPAARGRRPRLGFLT